jgi:hypothetical protein
MVKPLLRDAVKVVLVQVRQDDQIERRQVLDLDCRVGAPGCVQSITEMNLLPGVEEVWVSQGSLGQSGW